MDITERKWLPIAARTLTADGGLNGEVSLSSTLNFRVKQRVYLKSSTQIQIQYEVRQVNSPTSLELGVPGTPHDNRANLTAFLLSDNAVIYADSQARSNIALQELNRVVYAEEPIMAIRTHNVDPFGQSYTVDNPLPVELNGEIHVDNLSVQLTAKDDDPKPGDIHDSIRIGDGDNEVKVNPDGSFNVVVQNSGGGSSATNLYAEANAVAAGVDTVIQSYVVPVGDTAVLERITVSGDYVASFWVTVDGQTVDKLRTYYGAPGFNAVFEFSSNNGKGFGLTQTQTVEVHVIHQRPNVADFNCRIQLVEM